VILIDNGELMADEKMLTNVVEPAEEDVVFHLFFLANDENKSVKIEEVRGIDFEDIMEHLLQGESVFIALKYIQRLGSRLTTGKVPEKKALSIGT
jgi:hypothetical protein